MGGVLRPSVAPIHLLSQAFPGLEAVGEQRKLPLSSWPLLSLWIGGRIRGHHVLSKPSQNSGPVIAVTPAVCRPEPNSRAASLKCSIKILEDSSVQIFSVYTSLDSGGCKTSTRQSSVWWPSKTRSSYSLDTQPDLYFGKEFGKAESSNAIHVRDDDQIQAYKYFW